MARADYISIQEVTKRFGSKVTAVDDVSLDIRQGEFFSLLGASGCGKTTLLRLLAGFEQPSSGEIMIDGQPLSGVPAHQRPTNMVFQSYAIFPHLNVIGNVAYGLRKDKLPREELRNRVEQALHMVKLDGLAERKATELSGGQRQRVALARALVKRPKVLLLDEPLSALDKKLREDMQIELRLLQQEVGITFVFVTHDQEEALTMSDRIAVMSGGKVLQIASPTDLYERPTSTEVAGFIGQMNFFPAEVASLANGQDMQLEVDGVGPARVAGEAAVSGATHSWRQGEAVTLALRPERLRLGPAAEALDNRMTARIEAVAYLGDRCHVHLRAAGLKDAILVTAASDLNLAQGAEIAVGWPAESGVLLSR
ncbi:MAG: ABC transporter ATP-binding protein [Pseudomonadota bacterium]